MIKNLEDIKKIINLNMDELDWFEDKRAQRLEFGISDNIAALLKSEPVRKQFLPQSAELETLSLSFDPLEEVKNSFSERLIHRYKNRVALLVTDKCFAYCRHCFRRRFTSSSYGFLSQDEINQACDYISNHSTISEILLTGGDPLTGSNKQILNLLENITRAKPDIIIRLCTRALLSLPSRFDNELCNILKSFNEKSPVFLLVQFNHSSELCQDTKTAIERIRKCGIMLFNQTVLLKGINDSVKVQADLAHSLLHLGIKPYYVFLPDKVAGTSHFRVDVQKAIDIERNLRAELSGLEMPTFALDLPESGGKIPIHFNYIKDISEKAGESIFISPEGHERNY